MNATNNRVIADQFSILARKAHTVISISSLTTRHRASNHDCLIAVCSHMFDLFSLAQAHNQFHLDVLEAVYIKLHSTVLCQQKEYLKVLYLV